MTNSFNLEQRKPIWKALSELYLDTELKDYDFIEIAFTFQNSPYSFDEIKSINKYEVFPILCVNLLSSTGIWYEFDEKWLVDKITSRLKVKTKINDLFIEVSYLILSWLCIRYWRKLETMYNEIKENPDSYILTCRTAYLNNLKPFQFNKDSLPIYNKLERIALGYKQQGKLKEFYSYLLEGQYYINFWTAYFIIELFDLSGTEKLVGLNDNEFIIEHCYKLIESHFQTFKDIEQVKNCSNWLEAIKTSYKIKSKRTYPDNHRI